MHQQAVIGLIGGMSWESTAEYYRLLNELTRERLGGLHSSRCVLYSVDFAEIERLQTEGRWDKIIYIDTPDGADRRAILRVHLGKRGQDPEALDLAGLAAETDRYSGAELEAAERRLRDYRSVPPLEASEGLIRATLERVDRHERLRRLRRRFRLRQGHAPRGGERFEAQVPVTGIGAGGLTSERRWPECCHRAAEEAPACD